MSPTLLNVHSGVIIYHEGAEVLASVRSVDNADGIVDYQP